MSQNTQNKACIICQKKKKKYEFSLKDKNVCRLCYKPELAPGPKPTNKIKCLTCKKTKHKSNFVLKTKCIQCQSDFIPKRKKVKEKPIKKEVTLFDLQQLEKEKLAKGYKWKTVIIDRIKTRKLVKGCMYEL